MQPDRWIGWIGRAAAALWLGALLALGALPGVGVSTDGIALALAALVAGVIVLALEALGAGLGAAHDATDHDRLLLRRNGEPRRQPTRPPQWN